jgi:hypothetical protein
MISLQAIVTDAIVLNQGGQVNADGSICCEATSPECKVQTGYQVGQQFFSFSQNLTAMKNPDNSGVVTDYNAGKEYQVDGEGNCQAYCPLGREESEIFPFAIDPNATNLGSVPCGADTCTQWQFTEVIPILNITMEVTDYFITTVDGSPAPSYTVEHIEPLGDQIGDENTTFASWKDMDGKTFPATAFTIKGAAACPMSQQCQGDDDGQGSNDNMPVMYTSDAPLLQRFGMRIPGTNHRSTLFTEQAAAYAAKQEASRFSEAIEEALAALPARFQAAARARL